MSNYYNRQWRLPNNENKDKQSNYSMDFDGASYIDLGNSSLGLTANTISIWFKTTSTTSGQQLLSKMGSTYQFQLRLETNGTISLYSFQDQSTFATLQSSSGYNDGNWHNVITTFNTTDGHKMYVDGNTTPVDTDTVNKSALQSSSERMLIGVRDSSTGVIDTARYFNGQIDGISIYNYALSTSQVTTLYGSSSNGIGNPMSLSPKPVAYYPLGDQDAFNGSSYLTPNSSLKDYVFDYLTTNSYIDTNFTLPASYTSYSYSIWYKQSSSFTGDNYLIGNWNQGSSAIADMRVSVRFNGGTKLRIITGNGTTAFQSPDLNVSSLLLDGHWHHIVVTVVSGEIKLYIDKNLEATHSNSNIVTGIVANRSYTLGFSGNTSYAGYLDNSQLSNFQIFNTALSATGSNSVETLYNNGSPLTSMSGFTSLQAWYKLDASEVYNSSTTEWSVDNNAYPSTFKSALNFDGTDDYISTTALSNFITNNVSISAWVNYSTLPSGFDGAFLGTQSFSTGLGFYAVSGVIRFAIEGYNTNYVANTVTLSTNQWYHFCGTWNGSTIELFVNGVSQGTDSYSGSITTSNQLFLGRVLNNSYNINGKLSNVAIYNTALSASNVATLYNNGVPQATIYGSPVSHYKLDNTTTGIEDSAGSNDGTNNGAIEVATYVNTTAGTSSGMTQANLVQSDLSFTSGYSPYALEFDGTNDYIDCGTSQLVDFSSSFTISAWVYITSTASGYDCVYAFKGASNAFVMFFNNGSGYAPISFGSANYPTDLSIKCATNVTINKWNNIVVVYNGNGIATPSNYTFYIDNTSHTLTNSAGFSDNGNVNYIGRYASSHSFTGSLSNISIWNDALTSSQVSEIYNEGVPSNLNNHSAYSNLVSWWQLGSNSSFNTNWTVLDEKGTNNGTSGNMTEDDIVDGVGSYANGISSGMGGDEVTGDAPYSTANSLSVNMDVLDRTTDTPS